MPQIEAREEQKVSRTTSIPQHTKKVLKGNSAAAVAAKLSRVGFVTAYPITPQTSIIEEISSMIARKEFDATCVNMDSEHSVFAALKGAALVGERVFSATSGQGLLYAHEVLHAIAHMRLPLVACNVGRPSFPWNIWADQTDSLSQRDTGWIQFYCESSQEVLDTIIQAYKLAEKLNLPVLVVLDAFYLSHTSENVYIPDQELVDRFCPAKQITDDHIDLDHPKAFGGLVAPTMYDKYNKLFWNDMNKAEDETVRIGRDFGKYFGRTYSAVESINIHDKTKKILVTMSSITTTARNVIKDHPDVGILKIRLFKPFPKKTVLDVLKKVADDCIIVNIDRNFPGDREGVLMQEMKRTLYEKPKKLFGVYAGLGGRDVSPETISKIITIDFDSPDTQEITWVQ